MFIRHADPGRIGAPVVLRADGQAGGGGAGDARDQGFAPSPGFDQGRHYVGVGAKHEPWLFGQRGQHRRPVRLATRQSGACEHVVRRRRQVRGALPTKASGADNQRFGGVVDQGAPHDAHVEPPTHHLIVAQLVMVRRIAGWVPP